MRIVALMASCAGSSYAVGIIYVWGVRKFFAGTIHLILRGQRPLAQPVLMYRVASSQIEPFDQEPAREA